MYKTGLQIIGVLLLLNTFLSCQSQKKNFQTLDVKEFASFIQDGNVQRVDVRTLAEFSEGHIPQAININVLDKSFSTMADSLLQKEKPVALYCRSGKRSQKAAQILSEKGYKVVELGNGFNAWQEAKEEIVR